LYNYQKTGSEAAMRQLMMTVMALAVFRAMAATAQAEILHGGPVKTGKSVLQVFCRE
jgi:hypothetical protein